MKSIISGYSCKKVLGFPKLMESTANEGYVVLFISEKKGTVVSQGEGHRQVGSYVEDWVPSVFVDFTGSICLENDK